MEDGKVITEKPQIFVERTLAIIKPDAVNKSSEIEEIILRAGFTVLQKRRVHLTPEQASDFYAEHYGKMFFPSLVAFMSSGPIVVYSLGREHAIQHWRKLIGNMKPKIAKDLQPDSIRAIYGTDDTRNAVHGSDSFTSAEREIRFMFPESTIEPIPAGQYAKDYLSKNVNPVLLKGLTELCKNKPADPITWLADWLLENNPNKPNVDEPLILEQPLV